MKRLSLTAMINVMEKLVKRVNNRLKAAERQKTHREENLLKRDRALERFIANRKSELQTYVDALQLLYDRRPAEPALTDNGMSLIEAADAGASVTNLFYAVEAKA
jgi:hypothetical protein